MEYLRKRVVNELFSMSSFSDSWDIWKEEIVKLVPVINASNILNIGENLREVFRVTGTDRSQSQVSAGGNAWEALVCYYMNLCLIGTDTVVIKQKKTLVPSPIMESLSVKYDTFKSNTESDLIAITFPNKSSYNARLEDIYVVSNNGKRIENFENGRFNYLSIINRLAEEDFELYKVLVIQCKTNWNDNAQIPMLWDMLYASDGFYRRSITIGTSEYNIRNLTRFGYAFVTVPTNSKVKYTSKSTAVKRVRNLTGGNYWGRSDFDGVALSLKEIFNKNSLGDDGKNFRKRLDLELNYLSNKYDYFNLI